MSKAIHIVLVSWKSPEILEPCIKSILDSKSSLTEISVVLNEADYLSAAILAKFKINFISFRENYGQLGVDSNFFFIDKKTPYILFPNDDMIFCPKWEEELLNELESGGPCSVSMPLIEPEWYGHPMAKKDKLVENIEHDFNKIQPLFWANWLNNKYQFERRITWNHPIAVKQEDWVNVNGYSDNMNLEFWPGGWTDDYFAYRLWKLHNGNFNFKTTSKACVYHGQSLSLPKNSKKVPQSVFEKYTKMTPDEFKKITNQYASY